MNTQTAALQAWPGLRSPVNTTRNMSAQPDAAEEDFALMRAVAQGDESALGKLIDKWKTPLINFFYRSLGSVEQSEDLAQVTFIRVYRAAHKYEPSAKFSTYLFHIARRLLINEYRRQSRKPLDAIDPSEITASIPGREPLKIMEIEEAFAQALKTLPENQKTALLLLKQQELSYEQIANIMSASENAVKTWIHRGRKKLKEELKDFYENA